MALFQLILYHFQNDWCKKFWPQFERNHSLLIGNLITLESIRLRGQTVPYIFSTGVCFYLEGCTCLWTYTTLFNMMLHLYVYRFNLKLILDQLSTFKVNVRNNIFSFLDNYQSKEFSTLNVKTFKNSIISIFIHYWCS